MGSETVSVIIPSFNRFQFVMNAVQSIKRQTYPNIEIIVVNDASTEPGYYAYDWAGNGISIVHLEQNTKELFGMSCAGYVRNKGVELATGKYVAFCDDDDIWFPKKIELQLDAMKDTGCRMSATDGLIGIGVYDSTAQYPIYNAERFYTTIRDIYRRKTSRMMENGYPRIWSLDFLKIHNTIVCSSVLMEVYIYRKINGMCQNNRVEDYDCWLRALEHTDCVYVDAVCFYYDEGHRYGSNLTT